MSITSGDFRSKVTSLTLLEKKQKHEPITCLTAYDYASARLVDEAGIDMVLVGDSLGMVMLGYENTLPVTVEEMLAPYPRGAARREACILDRGHAVCVVSRERQRDCPQRGAIHQGGRRGGEDRGRREACAPGGPAGGCGNPGGRPHRIDSSVAARHGRIQGAGKDASGGGAADA